MTVNNEKLHTELVVTIDGFNVLHDEWNNLLVNSEEDNPFLSHEWLSTWWKFHGHGQLHIIVVRTSDSDELVGLLPLFLSRSGFFPPVYKLRFMGSDLVSSDFLNCLAHKGMEHQIYRACVDALHHNSCKWDIVELQDMAEDSSFYKYLISAGIKRCYNTKDLGKCCPFLHLPESWEVLQTKLSKKMRQRVGYYRRSLERKYDVLLELVNNPADLPEALTDMIRLRQDRMNQKGLDAAKVTEVYRDFHGELMMHFISCNRLKLYFLRLDCHRIAYLYLYVGGSRIYFYQTGFDRNWNNQSVGFVLLGMVIEKSIQEGFTTFEFLRGDEHYKYEWGDVCLRQLVDIVVSGESLRARLWRIRSNLILLMKGIYQRVFN